MTCESNIKKSYYQNEGRALKLKPNCIYCGSKGGKDFLLGTDELSEHCLMAGYSCYLICVDFLGCGEKVLTHGNVNSIEAKKEKERMTVRKKATKNSTK